ncbi:hypothetical protein NQ307_27315, partial [Escherichia coli]|nr:hypothetical protein [Escherichia coli]
FYYSKMESTYNTYQGIRVFDFSGKHLSEKIFHPNEMMNVLKKMGLTVSRIENEGVIVKNNTIYSMYIYSDRYHHKT